MTCIVGIEHEGYVYLGGDSAASTGFDVNTRTDEKVFENNEFIMGFVDSFRMGQLLRYAFEPPEHSIKKNDMQYLVIDFVDSLRDLFKDKGFLTKDEEDSSESGGTFLLGYKKKLYTVGPDFQIGHTPDGFTAIGCGEAYALGSLYSTQNIKNPIERLQLALESAEKFCGGVKAPFNYVSTKHNGYINLKTFKNDKKS